VSPHVTGATIDLAKLGLSRQQLGWLRRWLLPLQQAAKLDVEEEFHQSCFHITVYKSYLPPRPARRAAQARPSSARLAISPALAGKRMPGCLPESKDNFTVPSRWFKGTIAGKAKRGLARKTHERFGSSTGGRATSGLTEWQRVTNTFTAPSKTFEDIKRGNKSWWMPFVIIALVGYILFAAVFLKIGMQQVVDNQIRLDPKAEERLAQVPAEQRAMQTKISVYITEGVFIANPVLVLIVLGLGSLVLWAPSTSLSAVRLPLAVSFPCGCLPHCGHHQGTAGDCGDLCRRRA